MGHGQLERRATAVLVMGTLDRAAAHVKIVMLLIEPKKFLAAPVSVQPPEFITSASAGTVQSSGSSSQPSGRLTGDADP